jgi:cellulose synthase/poly-beta-1,6-N-acetylglucosamine synthase-like glycosyltransferase
VLKGWRAARHDWIVIADSNVLMPRDYIERLFASWRADTGLVASPPIGCRPQGLWAELECAFLNTYQARWQYLADALGFGFAQGKTMLWRRADLERAGGIAALAREVAEDAASTKVVRSAGLKVRLVDRPFPQPLGYRSAAEVWSRQLRWARLRRASLARCHSVPSGTAAKCCLPRPQDGTFRRSIRSTASRATCFCLCCSSARCAATTSSGAATRCRSSVCARAG